MKVRKASDIGRTSIIWLLSLNARKIELSKYYWLQLVYGNKTFSKSFKHESTSAIKLNNMMYIAGHL